MHPILNIAVKAARRAGSIINRASLDIGQVKVTVKQHSDFVTEVDQAAEAAIIDVIRNAYPGHGILAEESGHSCGSTGEEEFQWIIDPLDGTTNFIHGFPQYAISIGIAQKGVMQHAVVYDPNRNELFTASKGGGAFLNEKRIRVSTRAKLQDALIGTGFPYRVFDHIDAYLGMFRDMAQKTAGMRRPGAASLDLAYVACGRMDGFFELGLSPWDMAAGSLLITEAGGLCGDLTGEPNYMETGNIIGGNPKVFAQLLQVVYPHLNAKLKA
ncbi:MAG TPA: inositol monophosphatase family protein [Rhodocyclaceae bacterium]|nr:inositol monophosphatase family protein [Rhodocyclaceae bacterium]